MNTLRQKRLEKRLKEALASAIAAQEGHLEFDSRIPCTAVLIGGSVAAGVAVGGIKSLDRLWGLEGNWEKARRLLLTFALRLLSTWLGWLDGDRPEDEKNRARELWGEVVLTLFDDVSEDNLNGFIGRDLQYRYETSVREERQKTGEGGGPLVGVTLLLSDAHAALGGQALLYPTPITGYPYESIQDMRERGGVKETRLPLESFVDSIAVLQAVGVGSRACAAYYRENTEKLDNEVAPILAQLKELLRAGYTVEGLKKDVNWSSWIDFFESRDLLKT
ncbi:MAG TPA: hypothetical protein VJL07_06270 [Dehalococcoidia bacterium]|nr:hypothetical protein [Dehalococcoidia bacterium]